MHWIGHDSSRFQCISISCNQLHPVATTLYEFQCGFNVVSMQLQQFQWVPVPVILPPCPGMHRQLVAVTYSELQSVYVIEKTLKCENIVEL